MDMEEDCVIFLAIDSPQKNWQVIFDELLGFSSPPSPIDKGEKKKGKKEKKEKKKGKKERKKGFEEEAEKEGEKSKRVLVTNGDWSDFQVVATSGNRRPIVSLRSGGTICPHFVLVRKLVDKLVDSYRNALFGLLLSQVPSINSLQSVFMCLERPVLYSALWGLRVQHGPQVFPTIPLEYFSHPSSLRIPSTQFPLVAKVGNAEAGYGKLLFKEERKQEYDDFVGLVSTHSDFVTLEKFMEKRDFDLRIQRIGSHIRAYKRTSNCGSWKTNVGSSSIEEIEVTEEYKTWTDLVSNLFDGGMNIFTVDALHCQDGQHFIIEVNDSASGLLPTNEKEDMHHIAQLCIDQMKQIGLL